MLATVRPRDIAGKTRRRIAAEELAELVAVETKIKKSTAELKTIVLVRGSHLMDLHGVGPVVAARVLADVGDITRFADRNRFASWTGTAPLEAIRCLKRRISDAIYRQLLTDAHEATGTGPGGHCGATRESSAVDLPPHIDTSDQPLPGPAAPTLRPAAAARKTHHDDVLVATG